MVDTIEQVSINLMEIPAAGPTQVIIRMKPEDRNDINNAARKLGMLQADYLRTVVLNATRKINAEG